MNEDFLRAELREALAGHRPDRTVMLNRIAANRAEQVRPRGRVLRLAGAALAVTTVLGLGGIARWALADDAPPPPPVPAAPAPALPSPSVTPTPSPSPTPSRTAPSAAVTETATKAGTAAPPSPAPTSEAAGRIRGLPGDTQVEKGTLKSEGTRDGGTTTVTMKPGADLTELDLVIRIVRKAGLAPAGTGTDAPAGDVTGTVERRGDAILYRFTLRPGATLPSGTYRFTAQHNGTTGNASADTYDAYVFSVERKRIHVYGNFGTD
jgi:hypothetical protein